MMGNLAAPLGKVDNRHDVDRYTDVTFSQTRKTYQKSDQEKYLFLEAFLDTPVDTYPL